MLGLLHPSKAHFLSTFRPHLLKVSGIASEFVQACVAQASTPLGTLYNRALENITLSDDDNDDKTKTKQGLIRLIASTSDGCHQSFNRVITTMIVMIMIMIIKVIIMIMMVMIIAMMVMIRTITKITIIS